MPHAVIRWTSLVAFGLVVPLFVAAGVAGGAAHAQDAVATTAGGLVADIAVSPETDDLYVAFDHNGWIERPRFSTQGQAKGDWRVQLFGRATAVGVNAQTGSVYGALVRQGKMEVHEFSDAGRHQRTWQTGFTGRPTDMVVDERGEITVLLTSPGLDRVKADMLSFTLAGVLQDAWVTYFDTSAATLARDADRAVYVAAPDGTDAGIVRKFASTGSQTAEWAVAQQPLSMVAGPDDLFVAGTVGAAAAGTVQRFSLVGDERGTWAVGGRPLGIDIGPDETVYVLVQPSPGLSLVVEKRTMDGRLLLRWSAVARLFLPLSRRGG
jgi:hypothetical protein